MADQRDDLGGRSLQLQATGVTLIGILLGVATTVGFGVGGDWWVRLLAGSATFGLLLVLVRTAAKPGRGPLARLARWITRS